MQIQRTIYTTMAIALLLIFPDESRSQNLEVEGRAKITVMDTDNGTEDVVVRQSDGTLAVRTASSLSGGMSSIGNYGTVISPMTGKIWLDRNLGATQVATSSADTASYGDLYQWGRNADGHQRRTPNPFTTTTQANNFFTNDSLFITGSSNWLSAVETHMWTGTAAENNPCPSGFRIPTAAEWEQERRTWSSNDAAGAFSSSLKLPLAGFRLGSNGLLGGVGTGGGYWSSTVSGTDARSLSFGSSNALMDANGRANGASVRCLKD